MFTIWKTVVLNQGTFDTTPCPSKMSDKDLGRGDAADFQRVEARLLLNSLQCTEQPRPHHLPLPCSKDLSSLKHQQCRD